MHKGREFLVEVDTGSGFVAIGFLQTKSLSISSDTIDVTDIDSNDWRTLDDRGLGSRSMAFSGSGVLDTTDAALVFMEDAVWSGTLVNLKLTLLDTGSGHSYEGVFKVTTFDRSGEHGGIVTFSMSAESAGVIDAPFLQKLVENQIIVQPSAAAFDYTIDTAISGAGEVMVMGAPTADHTALSNPGAAWVYENTAGSLLFVAKLTAPDALAEDKFGHAVVVSADGSTIAIAAHEQNTDISDGGAVYIFTKVVGVWTFQQRLVPIAVALQFDRFGFSISLSDDGNTILIGSPFRTTSVNDDGIAYIFTRSVGVWTQQAKLTHATPTANDTLGYCAHLSGDGLVAFVGATMVSSIGGVMVYKKGAGWVDKTEDQRIQHAGGVTFDYFGASVNSFFTFGGTAISSNTDGTKLFVGAYGVDGAGSNRGAVFYYVDVAGTMTFSQKIEALSVTQDFHWFGYSVSCDGTADKLLIGAQSDDSGLSNAGRFFYLEWNGSTYVESATTQPLVPEAESFFSNKVDISKNGSFAMISASDYDGGFTDTGASYFYQVN